MIHRLTVKSTDPKKVVCPWWGKVEGLKDIKTLEFGPGLNVLFGRNGSGKSTILQTIAKMLCCFDGDHQLVGNFTSQDLFEGRWDSKKLKSGIKIEHDGSPIMHFDPSQKVGIIGGSFDWDFGMTGLQNTMFRGSAGQTTLMRMDKALQAALEGEWPEIEWKTHKNTALAEFLAGDGTKVRPTLLMDEPSRSLDLRTEIRLFEVLQKIADSGVQVIVATHSVFALHLKDAQFFDLTPNYSAQARAETELYILKHLVAKPDRLAHMVEFLRKHLEGETAESAKKCPCGRKTCDGGQWEWIRGTHMKTGLPIDMQQIPPENLQGCTLSFGVKHRKKLLGQSVGAEVDLEFPNWREPTILRVRRIS